MSRVTHYAIVSLLAAASTAGGQAGVQQASCTYERCALRVEAVPGTPKASQLVQGIEAKPVETSGFFLLRIPLFDSSPDSVRAPYYAFRNHLAASRASFVLGVAAAAVGAISFASQQTPRFANILPMTGLGIGLGITGLVETKQAGDALQTAVTRYNAALPDR